MRLSLSWIIVFLLLAFISYFFSYGCKVYEQYIDVDTVEGFQNTNDISLTTCPPSEVDESLSMSSKVPVSSTQTYCYDSGRQMCSLSVPSSSNESCTSYYKLLLQLKSDKCPTSMPNYYQDLRFENNVDKSVRGCTSGLRTPDGKSPADTKDSHCTLYNTEKDELEQLDSCKNIKRLNSAKCFSQSLNGVTKVLRASGMGMGSPTVECTYNTIEIVKSTVTTDVNAAAEAEYAHSFSEGATAAVNNMRSLGPVKMIPQFMTSALVGIYSPSTTEYLHFSQIVIRGENGENIAPRLFKIVNPVPQYTQGRMNTQPEIAIDGTESARAFPNVFHSRDQLRGDGLELHTNNEAPVKITSITIYNRSDCCQGRLTNFRLYVPGSMEIIPLSADLVQTFVFSPPAPQAKMVTTDVFTPTNITYRCTDTDSYRGFIDSIKTLYPDIYARDKSSLDSSESWQDDYKNSFCSILEQTKINKTMTPKQLKKAVVL
jgi:hypothetical protein